ncbi:MAG: O-antigen ligase family protein [Verrucomicrobiales bacterium]
MESGTVGNDNSSERLEKGDGYKRFSGKRSRSIDLEVVDDWLEKGILGLILAILVYSPLALGAVRNSEWAIVEGLTVGIMALWAVRLWVRPSYRILWAPVCWSVLAFTGFVIYGYETALVEWLARQELLQVLTYAVLFFAILDNCHKQEHTQIILLTLVFVGMGISIYAVYQYMTESGMVWWFSKPVAYAGRASGTYFSPNHFAGFVEMLIPVALGFVFLGRSKALWKVFIGYAALVMIAGLAVSVSRGGWIGAAVGMLILFGVLFFRRETRIPSIIMLSLLILGGVLFGVKSYQAQKRVEDAKGAQHVRSLLWKPAFYIWKDHPWTGVGPNHYDVYFRKYREFWVQTRPVYAHNDYLNTLADYGIIGSAIILSALAFLLWGVLKTWKFVKRTNEIANKPSNRSAVALGCACGLAAIAVHSVFDFNMHIPANAMVAITLMAVLTGHLRFATERHWVNPGWIGRISATMLLAAIAWVIVPKIYPAYLHDVQMRQSRTLPASSMERMEMLKQAHLSDPKDPETVIDIAELYRQWGSERYEGYEIHLLDSMKWARIGMSLNPLNPYSYLNFGMSLHWLDRHEDAKKYFDKVLELDPENHYLIALYGWHHLQLKNLEEARKWLMKSIAHKQQGNEIAPAYLKIVERLLAEKQENR